MCLGEVRVLKREIRFPDAGKDERGVPVETSGSWGVREALVGTYRVCDLITVILGPCLPRTLLATGN